MIPASRPGPLLREPVEGRRVTQDVKVAPVDRAVERELMLGLAGHSVEVEGRSQAPALARPQETVVGLKPTLEPS